MGQALKLKSCDLQAAANNRAHHTDSVSTRRLLVRRGQPFAVTLHFLGPARGALQRLRKTWLVLQTGCHPSETDGSLVQLPISTRDDSTGWKVTLEALDALSWTLTVTSPASAAIGHYKLLLHRPGLGKGAQHLLGTFTVLFNPWCPDDNVFLPNEAQRQEYVCNQDGSIYWGLQEAPLQQPWHFGQFAEDIVELSLALLDISLTFCQDSACGQRSDPVQVCRLVNAMLNSKIHRAILEGRWTGEYSDGTPPFKWGGSTHILRQWLAARGRPVRYGQCWVFAAVVCTVLRSIGIPTRVVTNFSSAQDTGGSLQVNEYFDEQAAQIPGNSAASIWPFHAWNECWMVRGDLPPGYDGWQALDATSQEHHSGASCCGPAPVRAVKEGRVDLLYDAAAFFAATNARCVAWVRQANGEFVRASSSPRYVGNTISTKGLGSERREDVTQYYKYPEGSAQERAVLETVCQALAQLRAPSEEPLHPLALLDQEAPLLFARIQAESCLLLGQEVKISVCATNRTGQEQSVRLAVGAQPLQYDGKTLEQFWTKEFCFTLPHGHEEALSITLTYADYGPALHPGHLLKLTTLLRDSEAASTGGHLAWQEICFHAPELSIQVPSQVAQFQPTEAEILVHNPLPEPLSDCVVSVSGRGLIHRERRYKLAAIRGGSTARLKVLFTATQAGTWRLLAQAESGRFQSLKGCTTIDVRAV